MNAAFTGHKRSGKTTLAFDIAMRDTRTLENGTVVDSGGILIYDPKREWRDWPGTISDVSQLEKMIDEKHEVIVYHPEGNKREAFTPLAQIVSELHRVAMENHWDKIGYHFTLIVDEAVNVSTAHFVDDDLLSLVAENRPEILNIFLTFQSPKDINNLLKSRISDYYIFQTSLPSDLSYLSKELGVPNEDLEMIQHLRPHEYAHFYFDGGTPKVSYEFEADTWFRPLEFFEMNANEREAIMPRERDNDERDGGSLEDLFDYINENMDDFLDFSSRRRSRGNSRDRDRDRDRGGRNNGGRGRDRDRDFTFTR
jgi:hypothetical protein